MFSTPIKLGIATGVGYWAGGGIGRAALKAVSPEASPDAITAATWAGRVGVFFIAAAVLGR